MDTIARFYFLFVFAVGVYVTVDVWPGFGILYMVLSVIGLVATL